MFRPKACTLDEAVNLVKEGFQDLRLVREDLKDVKNACESDPPNHKGDSATEPLNSKQAFCSYMRGPINANVNGKKLNMLTFMFSSWI